MFDASTQIVCWIDTLFLLININDLVDQHNGLVDQHIGLVDQHKEAFISELKSVHETRTYTEFSYSSTADMCERRALLQEYKRQVGFKLLQHANKDAQCYSCDMCEKQINKFTCDSMRAMMPSVIRETLVHDIDVRWHSCDICDKKVQKGATSEEALHQGASIILSQRTDSETCGFLISMQCSQRHSGGAMCSHSKVSALRTLK